MPGITTPYNLQMPSAGLIGRGSGAGRSTILDAAAVRSFTSTLTSSEVSDLISASVANYLPLAGGTVAGILKSGTNNQIFPFNTTAFSTYTANGTGLSFFGAGTGAGYGYCFSGDPLTLTTGARTEVALRRTFAPTSGNATFAELTIAPTINQTGSASGASRGLYITPTITAAADWKAIEVTTGRSCFQAVEAAGNLLLQNSTTAVLAELSKTFTSSTNREYLQLGFTGTNYDLVSRVGSAGGSNQPIRLGHLAADGTTFAGLTVATSGAVTASGEVVSDANGGLTVWKTTDHVTNFGKINIAHTTSSNTAIAKYDLLGGGTIAVGWHAFYVGGVSRLEIDAASTINYGNLCFSADNTKDIGRLSPGPFRPRSVYVGTSMQIGMPANTPIVGTLQVGGTITASGVTITPASGGCRVVMVPVDGSSDTYIDSTVTGDSTKRWAFGIDNSANKFCIAKNASGSGTPFGSADLFTIDGTGNITASGNLTLQNSTTAVIAELSKTYTSSTNREYLQVGFSGTNYDLVSRVGSAGGSNQPLRLGHVAADGTTFVGMTVATDGTVTGTGNFSRLTGIGSEQFGANSTVGGLNSATAIGESASVTGTGGTAVGRLAVSANSGAAFGNAANGGTSGVSVGASATSGTSSTAIGQGATASNSVSIAIGRSATTTTTNQLVVGASGLGITTVAIGNGVTNAAPAGFTLHATGGSGTNIAGASITIAGGRGTGSAVGGDIIFQTAPAGASGSTLGTLTERCRISAAGAVTASGNLTYVPATSSITLGTNGQFAIEMTSNTAGNLVYRGSDGTTRRAALVFV